MAADRHSRHLRSWQVTRTVGPAGPFHQRPAPAAVEPAAWLHRVTAPALVLGSAQPAGVIDAEGAIRAGVEVTRRRSGGGLVALVPGNDCWIDLLIPRASALWVDDVGLAFGWVGAVWADALTALLPPDEAAAVSVHTGPPLRREAGRLVCFAGLGPGEVSVGGRKVVGLSLRRWRDGARFQCAMTWRWPGELVARHLAPPSRAEVEAAIGCDLTELPAGLPRPDAIPDPLAMIDAVLTRLPDPGPPQC